MKILSIPWSLLRNIYAGFFYIPTHLQHGSGNIRVYIIAQYIYYYIYIYYTAGVPALLVLLLIPGALDHLRTLP